MECVIKLQIEEFAQKPAMIGRYLLVEREKLYYKLTRSSIGSKKLVCQNQFDLAVKKFEINLYLSSIILI